MTEKPRPRKRQPKRLIECNFCGKFFKCINDHMLIHLGERPFKCYICGISFARNKTLAIHIRLHTKERPYPCNGCDKEFLSKSNRDKHEAIHKETAEHPCNFCNKYFKSTNFLKLHIKSVHLERVRIREFKCNFCTKTYRSVTALRGHIWTHTKEKPFSCSICHKAFPVERNLNLHLATHSKTRPYKCDLCPWTFRFQNNVPVHKKAIHFGIPQKRYDKTMDTFVKAKSHPCYFCKKVIPNLKNLEIHMDEHTRESRLLLTNTN